MATVTNWIDHLSASEVAGQVYPMVGSEMWWVLAGIIYWLAWTVSTANGEAEEQEKLARKKFEENVDNLFLLIKCTLIFLPRTSID